ncbi:hypothetical protein LEP1GSC017_2413 [Leptospira meyeri serovar Hardjo str. Went 5]|nr:hypothetical protein LEP1GSC017_2413 [Leptospira meyeri serovar Hardjo str. Went 5]
MKFVYKTSLSFPIKKSQGKPWLFIDLSSETYSTFKFDL